MNYSMEQDLINTINAQRAEAEEFSKQPGCWMGMLVDPTDTAYWSERVPTGTLREFNRINLEEDAYYMTADIVSKTYARSLDFANWSDSALQRHIDNLARQAKLEDEMAEEERKREERTRNAMCRDFGISRETLDRWLSEAEAA